ncbi:nucleotidyltransferase family protein [Candidatus Thiosymbion oneisti]|uniref:nucleotidyltransferase family protein n=1 Tax=Candidatus Thiosymbion oneisti TaxID=589554 RepID=UPI000B3234A4|nr:nucleotidyltransferase family protein [Candidatus Thiosymbion oneisti]
MTKDETLRRLKVAKTDLARRFGVTDLALFGSQARNDAGVASDVDILVSFDGPATSRRYFGVQFYLEDLLGRPVDLISDKGIRPELRPFIEREAIHV